MTSSASWDIAVVGAGPAGSVMAAELAKNGARVLIFDHSHPRAKPCSGFLKKEVFDNYPPAARFDQRRPFVGPWSYTSPSGHTFTISDEQAATHFELSARRDFDEYLIRTAVEQGANWIKEKVVGIRRKGTGWEIDTDRRAWAAGALVGADGARSIVRKQLAGPIKKGDLVVGIGRTYEGIEQEELQIRFFKTGGVGFALPGYGFCQIAIAQRLNTARRLMQKMRDFCDSPAGGRDGPYTSWVALQPSPVSRDFFKIDCSGESYCLIGDAAGHCDPLNGEGIPFAVHGALLAADAFLKGNLGGFDERWRDVYGSRLEQGAAKARRAPSPWIQDLTGWAFSRSPSLVDAVAGALSEGRSAGAVIARAAGRLPKIITELIRG